MKRKITKKIQIRQYIKNEILGLTTNAPHSELGIIIHYASKYKVSEQEVESVVEGLRVLKKIEIFDGYVRIL